MIEASSEKVFLVDGAAAGRAAKAPADWFSIGVSTPQLPDLAALGSSDLAYTLRPPQHTYYRIIRGLYRLGPLGPFSVRIGWSEGLDPTDDAIAEQLPTALAAEGLIPWAAVPETPLDATEPIGARPGYPSYECTWPVPEVVDIVEVELRARCACGWATGMVPAARRSQLLRAVHRHLLEMELRRHTEDLPIRILNPGVGPTLLCAPALVIGHEPNAWPAARCDACGWQVAKAPPCNSRKLMDLVNEHLAIAADAFHDTYDAYDFDLLLAILTGANRQLSQPPKSPPKSEPPSPQRAEADDD